MNVDSYWADEDDWDDQFCYREISPFDNSAACIALGAFTAAARTAHVPPEKQPEYVLIPHAEIIGETNRAIRVTTPICSDPFWLPKSVTIQTNNELKVLSWFYRKEIKPNENAEVAGTVVHASGLAASKRLANSISSKKNKTFMVEQIQKQHPRCPYCGGVGCDCGEDLD